MELALAETEPDPETEADRDTDPESETLALWLGVGLLLGERLLDALGLVLVVAEGLCDRDAVAL